MEKYNTEITINLKGHGIVKPVATYGINNTVIDSINLKENNIF